MKNESLRNRIIELAQGESITVSIDDYGATTVRSYASDLGYVLRRRFTARRSREDRSYTITRLA